MSVCRGAYIHYFKIMSDFLLSSLFWKLSQPLGQDQQNGKQTYSRTDYHISMDSYGLYSPKSFLNFFLNLYISPWLWESFKFIVSRLLQIHLWIKIESVNFYSCPKVKLSPRFLSLSHRQTRIAHSSQTVFSEDILSWAEGGGRGLWSWKNYQN